MLVNEKFEQFSSSEGHNVSDAQNSVAPPAEAQSAKSEPDAPASSVSEADADARADRESLLPPHWSDLNDDLSLVDEVYRKILLQIIKGELPGGTELKSTRLATEMGVSRTPVVQALARLDADGIVRQPRNHRAIVREGAEDWLVEIHEMRLLLEPAAARAAAKLMTDEKLNDLREMAAEVQRAAEEEDELTRDSAWARKAEQFDYAMHLAIADSCGNLPLSETIRKCWSFKSLSYEASEDSADIIAIGFQDHLTLLQALTNRDANTAAASMQLHLSQMTRLRGGRRIV